MSGGRASDVGPRHDGSIAEQLDLSSLTDERLLLTSGVLLVASLLAAEGRQDEAHFLIASAAPTYCAYAAEPSWMQYNLSSAELFEYAFEHREGPILDTDQLNDLVARCKGLLGVPRRGGRPTTAFRWGCSPICVRLCRWSCSRCVRTARPVPGARRERQRKQLFRSGSLRLDLPVGSR